MSDSRTFVLDILTQLLPTWRYAPALRERVLS